MQFNSKVDIQAPLATVFAALSDFEGWERAAMRRGADVSRTDTMRTLGPGVAWVMRFAYRGKERLLNIKLVTLDPAGKLAFTGTGKTLVGDMGLEVMGLAPNRTRLMMAVDVRPQTLGARLLLQTLKLGRSNIQTKLNHRMVALAKDIELRHAVATPHKRTR